MNSMLINPLKYKIIIPARAGSKRIPFKNRVDFEGIPLIRHSIDYAKKFISHDSIYVNTDDVQIQKIASEAGVNIYQRPSSLGGDYITTGEVLRNQCELFEAQNVEYNNIILLQATNPLRPKDLLLNGVSKFEKSGRNSLVTFSSFKRKFGKIHSNMFIPENYLLGQRSQELKPLYFENGLLYITKKDEILKGNIISGDCFPLVIDHPFADIDIDEIIDLERAKNYLRLYKNE